jgi:hypothetical protein
MQVRFQAAVRDFSLLQTVQTTCGAHQTSYSVGTSGSLHKRTYVVPVKDASNYTSFPAHVLGVMLN